MLSRRIGYLAIPVIASCVFLSARSASSQPADHRLVRLAELEIDPAQVEAYTAALREEIETSIRVEPGVLTLYAVAIKGHPEKIRLFEMYRDTSAYQSHLQTAHFNKYKEQTAGMVKSLTLLETEPVLLASKFK